MVKKICIIFLTILAITIILHPMNIVKASRIFGGADNFISDGQAAGGDSQISYSSMKRVSTQIYTILLAIGTGIAVIIGAILGIQFITGSVEQKVKVKESLMPFVVGCIVVFGAFGIWRLVILLLK